MSAKFHRQPGRIPVATGGEAPIHSRNHLKSGFPTHCTWWKEALCRWKHQVCVSSQGAHGSKYTWESSSRLLDACIPAWTWWSREGWWVVGLAWVQVSHWWPESGKHQRGTTSHQGTANVHLPSMPGQQPAVMITYTFLLLWIHRILCMYEYSKRQDDHTSATIHNDNTGLFYGLLLVGIETLKKKYLRNWSNQHLSMCFWGTIILKAQFLHQEVVTCSQWLTWRVATS